MNHKRHPLAAAIVATLAIPLGSNAFAQAQEETTLAPVSVKDTAPVNDYLPVQSSIGGKGDTPLRDIPQTVNVVNRAVLDAQNATTLKDALRNVPGITISAGEGGQIGDNINLRGFSARTDMFIDGFRDRGQYTRDTFYLDSVEVLKGPSSMLFGRGSTGGVINQNSKKPNLKASGEITASIGTDDYYRTTVDINRPLSDNAAFRVAAFGQATHSTRDVVSNKDFGVAPSLRLGIGEATEFIASALLQRNNDIPDYGVPLLRSDRTVNAVSKPVNASKDNFYGYRDDHFDQDVTSVNATIKHTFNDDVVLTNRTQFAQYHTAASPSPLSGAVVIGATSGTGAAIPTRDMALDQLQASRQNRDRDVNDSTFSNQTELLLKLGSEQLRHNIVAGLEFSHDRYENDTFEWSTSADARFINLGNPYNGYRSGQRELSLSTVSTADTYAVYFNDQLDIGKQWKVVAGLRYDRFDADVKQTVHALSFPRSGTTPSSYSADQNVEMLSTRLGLIWQPTEQQSYYISYGTSFNPSAEGLTLPANQADTDPEENRSYELGAKFDLLDGNLQLNGALFQIEKTDARTTVDEVVTLDGDLRVRGFEISAVGRLTDAWQVLAGYTHLDGKVLDSPESTNVAVPGATLDARTVNVRRYADGNKLQNTPDDIATLWTTYNVTDQWEIGGGAVYTSKRNVNNYENAVIDGYTRFDATVAYRHKQFGVRLNLQNLTDRTYYETASAGRTTPAAGRTAILTTSYSF